MQNLERTQAKQLCNDFIHMKYSDKEIAEILISLSIKGETAEEVSGFVDCLLENSEPFPSSKPAMDVCGTGGVTTERFNVSTVVAFILASLGYTVAKHGNRGSRKPNGSFDLLEAIGIPIDLNGGQLSELLENSNLCFIYARAFHPAVKNVANARKIVGGRTIFNLAGPLSNPANIKNQIIGTIDQNAFKLLLSVAKNTGRDNCIAVSGHSGIDEISTTGESQFRTTWDEKTFNITPEDLGLSRSKIEQIPSGDAIENAKEFIKIIEGEGNTFLEDMICANAGLAMVCQDKALSIQNGINEARRSIRTGILKRKVNEYTGLSNRIKKN